MDRHFDSRFATLGLIRDFADFLEDGCFLRLKSRYLDKLEHSIRHQLYKHEWIVSAVRLGQKSFTVDIIIAEDNIALIWFSIDVTRRRVDSPKLASCSNPSSGQPVLQKTNLEPESVDVPSEPPLVNASLVV